MRSKKKSNLEVLQDFVTGKYDKIQVGYNPSQSKRKIGETWTDVSGRKWIQKNGYISNVNEQADIIRAARKRICGKCNKDIDWAGNRFDTKFHAMTGWCFDCIIEEETRLRVIGKYKEYEQKKVLMNMLSSCRDSMQMLRDNYKYLDSDKGKVEFQNYVGIKNDLIHEEDWGKIDIGQVKKDIKKEFAILAKESWRMKKKIKSIQF